MCNTSNIDSIQEYEWFTVEKSVLLLDIWFVLMNATQ